MAKRISNQEMIDALVATNGLISLAAKKMGCSRVAIYKRAKRSPAVKAVIRDSRAELVDTAELALRAAVVKREAWAVTFTLRTLGANRGFIPRSQLEHSGRDGGPIAVQAYDYNSAISALAPIGDDDPVDVPIPDGESPGDEVEADGE